MRPPPHSLDSERAIIATCMYQGAPVIELVSSILQPEAFYSPEHRHTFSAIQELYSKGEPTEPVSVFEQLKLMGRDREIGGATALSKMMQVTPAIAYPERHAKLIQDYYQQRQALELSQRMVAVLNQPVENISEQILELSGQLSDIALSRRTNELKPLSSVMSLVRDHVVEAARVRKLVTGVPSGLDLLDEYTTGRHGGDVSVVAGRPGMGKTSLVLNWALNEARSGYVVPFFTLEMPSIQLAMRLLSIESRIDFQKLRTGTFNPGRWTEVTEAINRLCQLPIYLDDTSTIKFSEIRRRVQVLRRQLDKERWLESERQGRELPPIKFGAIKIDYLQLMHASEQRHNREEEVAQLSREAKLTAKELDLPIDLVSQLNRAPESRKDQRPTMGDLRNSGAIEQDADNIFFVYRDEYYNKDESHDKGIAEIIIAKQRNGPTCTVKVKWTGAYARFDNLAREYDDMDDQFDEFPGGL